VFLEFYKLAEQPFGVTPDPRYLYLSPTHSEAMASVVYGVFENRGFTALIAHPGMGKTTLLFDLLQRIHVSSRTVFLFQAQLSPHELLRNLLADLGIQDGGQDVAAMQGKLNDVLLREAGRGKRVVVVIDEAQTLDESALEVLRMLSNFETSREKLMHIVLAGQPQLADRLASPSMIQFRQRISIVARLVPFDAAETRAYIEHRLRVAGHTGWRPIFTDHAYALIARHAQGIPRNINNLCFNAMSLGCALRQRIIGHGVIHEVLRDLDLRPIVREVPRALATDDIPRPASVRSSFRKRLTLWTAVGALAAILCLPVPFTNRPPNDDAATKRATDTSASEATFGSIQTDSQHNVNRSAEEVSAENAISAQRTASPAAHLSPREPLYRMCIRNLSGYFVQVFQELRRLNPRQGPKRPQQGRLFSSSTGKLLTAHRFCEGAARFSRPGERRDRS
jgi:type II secretory pathway predicted ATPase ExeA